MKRWVLGGGPNEGEEAGFDMGQKGILLAFIEAVDFINEKNGAPSLLVPYLLSILNNLSHLFDPGKHG